MIGLPFGTASAYADSFPSPPPRQMTISSETCFNMNMFRGELATITAHRKLVLTIRYRQAVSQARRPDYHPAKSGTSPITRPISDIALGRCRRRGRRHVSAPVGGDDGWAAICVHEKQADDKLDGRIVRRCSATACTRLVPLSTQRSPPDRGPGTSGSPRRQRPMATYREEGGKRKKWW